MSAPRSRLLRRRDFHSIAIVSVIALCNLATTVVFYALMTPRLRSAVALSTRSRDISTNCYAQTSLAISNCIEYLSYIDLSPRSRAAEPPPESPDDVVGVYGYGQTHSSTSTWIYRDDRLRDGRSRRVYLKRFPR